MTGSESISILRQPSQTLADLAVSADFEGNQKDDFAILSVEESRWDNFIVACGASDA